jgi:hypothetical protein
MERIIMRKSLVKFLVAGVLSALALPAMAGQILPIIGKAPPPKAAFTTGSGFYIGAGTSAAVASANVSGNVISVPGITGGSVNAAGGTVDVDAGYIWSSCILNTWCQVELDGKYTNIDGSNAVGTISARWALTQEFDIGADVIQTVLSLFPTGSNPFPTFNPSSLLPSNIAVATTPRGYFGFKQAELLIGGNVGQSGGQDWAYAPGLTSGFRWQTLGGNGAPNGGSLKVFADILWANKGASIANLFGASGAPMVTQASATLNTLYVVGVHYDFGVGL